MNNPKITIRLAKPNDLKEIQRIFVDTISTICKDDYSPEQIDAWISSVKNTQKWIDKLDSQYFLIAELDTKIVGYASLEGNNYLDFLYVHKDYQRQGIGDELYLEIEKEAVNRYASVIRSDVSRTARPFFEKMGFATLEHHIKTMQGVEIINYKMIKEIFEHS